MKILFKLIYFNELLSFIKFQFLKIFFNQIFKGKNILIQRNIKISYLDLKLNNV